MKPIIETISKINIRYIFLHSWHPYAWLAIVGSLLYLQILTFSEYTYYDDSFMIVDSYTHIDKLSDIGSAFFEDVSHQAQGGKLYRPLSTVSLILCAQISGAAPFGYYLLDIILHCANCCLIFAMFNMLGFKRAVSFAGALIFCVHPALTQAIAWIPGRNDALLAVFILSCFIAYDKFLSTSLLRWYFVHILFFILALFTKETTVLFPLLALLFSFSVRRKIFLSLTTALLLIGWASVFVVWYVLRNAAQIGHVGSISQILSIIILHFWIVLFYIGNMFWPFHLAFAPIPVDINLIAGIISACLLLVAILFAKPKHHALILFGVAWFIILLVPTFLVQTPPKYFENRIYVPCIGLFIALLSFSDVDRLRFIKPALPLLLFLAVCTLGTLSYTYSSNFHNSLALNEYDASTSPKDHTAYRSITSLNVPKKLSEYIHAIQKHSQPMKLGYMSITQEDLWKVIDTLKYELNSMSHDSEIHHAMAVAYFARGFLIKSEENFISAIRENPQDADIHFNLGILYYEAHMNKKAEKEWLEAVRLHPTMGNGYLNLTCLYYEMGQYELAWIYCQKAMQFTNPPAGLIAKIQKKIPNQKLP